MRGGVGQFRRVGRHRMNDGPADPVTTLLECAIAMHELFLAYQQAGFTEQQAFALVQTTIAKPITHD